MSTRKSSDTGSLTVPGKGGHSRSGSSDRSHVCSEGVFDSPLSHRCVLGLGETRQREDASSFRTSTPGNYCYCAQRDHSQGLDDYEGDQAVLCPEERRSLLVERAASGARRPSLRVSPAHKDKFELTASAASSKSAGHIVLGSTVLVVRDGTSVNFLTEAGDTYSAKCTSVRCPCSIRAASRSADRVRRPRRRRSG